MDTERDARDGERTVTLMVYGGEPLARMAAQRLEAEGIPCIVRPLGVGPGGWGVAASIPHAVDTWEADAAAARELLGLPPGDPAAAPAPTGATSGMRLLMGAAAVLVVLALAVWAADALFGWLLP